MSSQDTPHPDNHVGSKRPERRYETRDVRLSAIVTLIAAIVLLAILTLPGLAYMLKNFRDRAAGQDPRVSPLIDPSQLPPEPRLQSTPTADYAEFLRKQQEQLKSYGWVDKEKGTVRIPISRAMDIALERGLPEPSIAPVDQGATNDPDASSTDSGKSQTNDDRPPAKNGDQKNGSDETPAGARSNATEEGERPATNPLRDANKAEPNAGEKGSASPDGQSKQSDPAEPAQPNNSASENAKSGDADPADQNGESTDPANEKSNDRRAEESL